MNGNISGRLAALDALAAFRKSRGRAPEPAFLIDDKRERAMARAIYWGVLQNRTLLDYYIGCYCSKPVSALDHKLADILEAGAYQLLYFDRVPARAVIFEAVEQVKSRANPAASGMVNAVLRRISENKSHLPPIKGTAREQLSVRYSFPSWLCEQFTDLLGEEGCGEFFAACNTLPELNLQLNPLKATMEQLKDSLSGQNIPFSPHSWEEGTLVLPANTDPMTVSAFTDGLCTVQDPAARLAPRAAMLQSGRFVLDVCAAPGGKSFAAAMDMHNSGRIVSMDISEKKLSKIEAGAARLGIDIIETRAADARVCIEEFVGKADAVLADVPCSGLGTLRKKPDIRYKTAEEIEELPKIQRDILENVCRYVKPGGVLLYSTCTLLPRENEDVTDSFLADHPEFIFEDFAVCSQRSYKGQLVLWPHMDDCDGFYIRKLRKV